MKNLKNYKAEDLVLKNVDINANVIANRVSITNTQHYENPYREAINITYVFPINHKAVVDSFIVDINGEKYEASIKSKKEANEIKKNEQLEGNTVAMLENDKSLFRFNIVNVPAKAKITIELKYVFTIEEKNRVFRLNIPTTIGIKYDNSEEKNFINKLVKPKHVNSVSYTYNLKIRLYNVKDLDIKSDHDFKTRKEENYMLLESNSVIPNRDFVLEYTTDKEKYILTSKSEDGEAYSYISCLNDNENNEKEYFHNKQYVFIMDNSGSMGGQKLEQAKNALKLCIRNLDETDKFNIVFFNSSFHALSDDFLGYNDDTLEIADKFIDEVYATGGTNIQSVLEKYCKYENTIIMLFTDGEVFDVDAVYRVIKSRAMGNRVFTFGIDNSIDVNFINNMAEYGRGRSEFLNTYEEIYEKTINQMMASLQKSSVCEIKSSVDIKKVDVFDGDNFSDIVIGLIKSVSIDDEKIDVEVIEDDSLYGLLRSLYFKELIEKSSEDENKCINYSILGNILCDYTTFILIKKNKEGVFAERDEVIGNMIPEGWAYNTLGGMPMKMMSVSMDAFEYNAISNNVSFSVCCSNSPRSPKSRIAKNYMNSHNNTPMETGSAKMTFIPDELNNQDSRKERLLELFLKQKANGSIDDNLELTKEAIKLFEELGRPSTFKLQYKKAVKYINKNNK